MICPYCDKTTLQSRIIFQNNLIMVFPTNIPITPGHVLICPIRHISTIDQLSNEELSALRNSIVQLKGSLIKSFGAEGFNIAWNEGTTAGQSVDHLHIHIVPRKTGDGGVYEYEPRKFLYRPGSRDESPDAELNEITKIIKTNLN